MTTSADLRLSLSGRGLIIGLVVWSLTWKGFSLWRAAKEDSKPWFVILLVSNTVGILDALYIFLVSGRHRRAERAETALHAATGGQEQLGHSQET